MRTLQHVNYKKTTITFIFASLSLMFLFAASASPIPLYSKYRATIGLTTETISLTAVFYFIGCIISLIILSRLSNHLGRKPVALTALGLGIVGLLLLIGTTAPVILIFARFFQGLACGLASSVMSVFIVESSINKPVNLVTTITGSAVLVGLALGGLLSGIFVQFNSHGATMSYWILCGVLLLCFAGILFGEETLERRAGALSSLLPQIKIPKQGRPYIPSAIGIFAGTWAMGGYFQAFSSTIGGTIFHLDSPMVSAIILASFMAPNLIGSSLSGKFIKPTGKSAGMLLFILCISLMYVSFTIKNFTLFLLTIIIAGVAQGIAYTNAMQQLLQSSEEEEKAGVLSVIYFISYGGAAIPSFILGRLSGVLTFKQVTLAYVILVLILGFLAIITSKKE